MNSEHLVDYHRSVSSHVLNNIPVKPTRAETLRWPIAFMTDSCKESTHETKTEFEPREIEVSNRILGWESTLDREVVNELNKLMDGINTNNPAVVIRAASGLGKSILLGKVVAELIHSKHNDTNNESDWPKFERILFSQLKDSGHLKLEKAICDGLDLAHKCSDFEQLFDEDKAGISSDGSKIIVIDSLDEHADRKEWWRISEIFAEKGWRVIWACRDPDWEHHKLGMKKSLGGPIPDDKYNIIEAKVKDKKMPWNRFNGYDWTLYLGKRGSDLEELAKDICAEGSIEEYSEEINKFVKYCYSKTQLMHIFYTNFSIKDETRTKLEKQLMEALLSNRESKIIENKDKSKKFELFIDTDWINSFHDSNLTHIIMDIAIKLLETHYPGTDECWKNICTSYYNSKKDIRMPSELSESIDYSELNQKSKDLLNRLETFGILREGFKFRHRDFATSAYVNGCPGGLNELSDSDSNDILFKHYFPTSVIDSSGQKLVDGSGNTSSIIRDFIRRNGNIISQVEPVISAKNFPDYFLMKKVMEEAELLIQGDKADGLSADQIKALKHSKSNRTIVLKGFPGTGKTFTGVERIIIRQVSLFNAGRTDAYSLIVSLNNQLAASIRRELQSNHIESESLSEYTSAEKEKILGMIHVRSLKGVIEEWAPDFQKDNPEWLIEDINLNDIFINMEKKNKNVDVKHWRPLQKEYQRQMFDERSGKFISLEKYIQTDSVHSGHKNNSVWKKIRTDWYNAIKKERERGHYSLVESCTVLRNRLLRNELNNSKIPNENWPEELYSLDLGVKQCKTEVLLEQIENQFQKGYYDTVMVDEVQDLPAMAINMLSFLCPNRASSGNYNRFIIAGDHLQTLNGQKFDWANLLKRLTDLTKILASDHHHIFCKTSRPINHHLHGLFWEKEDIAHTVAEDHHLTENYRNHKTICALSKFNWDNWPSKEYVNKFVSDEPPLKLMESKWKRKPNPTKKRLMFINTESKDGYLDRIGEMLEFLNSRAKVSLLYTNDWIKSYVTKEIMDIDTDNKSVEAFDPWTIKGLERDAVVMIGAYTASDNDPDSRELLNTNLGDLDNLTPSEKDAIDLLRRKMLVSDTRAVEQVIVVSAPKTNINLGKKGENVHTLFPKRFEGAEYSEINPGEDLNEKLSAFFEAGSKETHGIITISEGIDLAVRARTENAAKDQMKYYLGRLKTVLKNDPPSSILRKILFPLAQITENADLNLTLLIKDILAMETSNLSFIELPPGNHDDDDDDYSSVVKSVVEYDTLGGPWSSDGFDLLWTIINIRESLDDKIDLVKNSITYVTEGDEDDNLDKDDEHILIINDSREHVEKFLIRVSEVLEKLSSHMSLPKIKLSNDELVAYLFSDSNALHRGSINLKSSKNTDGWDEFILKLVNSLASKIEIAKRGDNIVTIMQNSRNTLAINDESWDELIEELENRIKDKERKISLSEYRTFATKFIQIVSDNIRSGKNSLVGTDYLNQRFKQAINLLVSIKNKKGIVNCRNEIIHFLSLGCPNYDKEEIKTLLESISNIDKEILDVIPDSELLTWDLYQFVAIIEVLDTNKNNNSKRRAKTLSIESQLLPRFTQSSYARMGANLTVESLLEDISYQLNQGTSSLYEKLIEITIKSVMDEVARVKPVSKYSPSLHKVLRNLMISCTLMPIIWKKKRILEPYDSLLERISKKEMNLLLKSSIANCSEALSDSKPNKRDLIDNTSIIKQLIKTLDDTDLPDQVGFINKFPAMQLSKAFSREQSQIFSKLKPIDVVQNMNIVNEMYPNWEQHSNLYKLFSTSSEESLPWKFDGFGKDIGFATSIMLNDKFKDKLKDASNFTNVLLNSFDLDSRYKKYLLIIDTAIHYLERAEGETMNLKTLVQSLLLGIGKNSPRPFDDIIHMEVGDESEASVFPEGVFGKTVKFKKQITTIKLIHEPNLSMDIVKILAHLGLDFELKIPFEIESNLIKLKETRVILSQFSGSGEPRVLASEETNFATASDAVFESIPDDEEEIVFASEVEDEVFAVSDEEGEIVFASEVEEEEILNARNNEEDAIKYIKEQLKSGNLTMDDLMDKLDE